MGRLRLLQRGDHGRLIRHIAGEGETTDAGCDPLCGGGVHVDDGDLCASIGQTHGAGFAKARPASGDNGAKAHHVHFETSC